MNELLIGDYKREFKFGAGWLGKMQLFEVA
jgi:hypothetical protein